jgi:hypothetical protein
MSDKFLNTGNGATNLTNGTANIYVATLASANLEPSRPIKTNAVRELVSQNLDIADVINLQSELNTKNELMFTEDDTHTNPPANTVKIYAKTDGQFYKKDSAGNETGFGGGGVSTTNAPVVDNSLVFYDGTTGGLIKSVTDMRYDSINNTLEVTDIETSTTFSLNGELQKVSNIASASQTPDVTVLNGELNVGKLKSITGNCEIELNNTDVDLLTVSGTVSINANDVSLSTPTITLNGNNADLWRKLGSTAGSESFYVGNLSGSVSTGNSNIGIGNNTLQLNVSGQDNIAIGDLAGSQIINSSQNICIGGQAGLYKKDVTAVNNIAIGVLSQEGVSNVTNGGYNTSVGAGTLRVIETGDFNTTMGVNAGFSLTSGSSNTFVGAYCGDSDATDVNNTGIGRNALTNGGTNRTVLGFQAETNVDNSVCIGNNTVALIKNLGNNTCDLGAVANQFKDLYLGGKANVADILVGGSGSIQRPFIITNPTYTKSLEIERQGQGMGIVFMDGVTSVGYVNSVNNDVGITATGNVNISTGLASTVTGLPLVNSFACSDETTPITTTGVKTTIRVAQSIQLYKIKVSLNVATSAGMGILFRKNGIQFAIVPMGTNSVVNATNSTVLVEDDVVTVEVSSISGSGTGTGLKVYLIGRTY